MKRVSQFQSEQFTELRVLGYVLATWHLPLEEALHTQLACIEVMLGWCPFREPVQPRILLPYFQSSWVHAARNCHFALRAPATTAQVIEIVAQAPEGERLRELLLAAASGFRIRVLEQSLK